MPTSQPYPSPSTLAMGSGSGSYYPPHSRRSPSEHSQGETSSARTTIPPSSESEDRERQSIYAPMARRADASPPEPYGRTERDRSEDLSLADSTTPRKRSKVSRACDECRRKKIRCDATTESGDDQCSSCKRVGTACQFSRIPMKRGPSKGYIRELADRLNTLENSMIPSPLAEGQYASHSDPEHTSPRAPEEYSAMPSGAAVALKQPRKRAHSGAPDAPGSGYLPQVPQRSSAGGWSAHDSPRHLPHPTSTLPNPQTPHSVSSAGDASPYHQPYRSQFSPTVGHTQPLWTHPPPDLGRRTGSHSPFDPTEPRLPSIEQSTAILDWHEPTVDEYYATIHPTLPLLAHSKSRLRSRLANCPVILREAFLEALSAAVRSASSSIVMSPPSVPGTKRASDLIAASQFESAATRTTSTNLIYLQTMILMAIEAGRRGPATTLRGQPGPPKSVWLGSAVGLAYYLRLHANRSTEKVTTPKDDDSDTDDRIGRRNWWVLVMLDRWHASSTATPLLIPETSVALLPEDQNLLGDSTFHVARLSIILGHLSSVFSAAPSPTPELSLTTTPSLITKLLHGELERFREHISPPLASLAMPHLCYWHVVLLVKRHTPTASTQDLLHPAQQIISLLFHAYPTLSSPMHHHFLTVAVSTLIELSNLPSSSSSSTADDAHATLEAALAVLEDSRRRRIPTPSAGWNDLVIDLIRAHFRTKPALGRAPSGSPHLSGATLARGPLQYLADLAVSGPGEQRGGREGGGGDGRASPSSPVMRYRAKERSEGVYDPTALTRSGYLNSLGALTRSGTPAGSDRG